LPRDGNPRLKCDLYRTLTFRRLHFNFLGFYKDIKNRIASLSHPSHPPPPLEFLVLTSVETRTSMFLDFASQGQLAGGSGCKTQTSAAVGRLYAVNCTAKIMHSPTRKVVACHNLGSSMRTIRVYRCISPDPCGCYYRSSMLHTSLSGFAAFSRRLEATVRPIHT